MSTESEPPAGLQTYSLSSRLVPSHPCEAPETPSPNQQVSVSPMKGKVAPGEAVPFVVTLKASVHASFDSMDLVCKVGLAAAERSWEWSTAPSPGGWGGL